MVRAFNITYRQVYWGRISPCDWVSLFLITRHDHQPVLVVWLPTGLVKQLFVSSSLTEGKQTHLYWCQTKKELSRKKRNR